MGADTSKLGAHSTAKDVVLSCGDGQFLAGRTALVTGGNSGIGLETCKALASAGCKVLMCSRSVENGEKMIKEELAVEGLGGYSLSAEQLALVQVRQLDLNSLASVRTFCDKVLEEKLALDYLILNAGVMAFQTREETTDGFEKQIGVNHFGHAYLVDRLYAAFTGGAAARKADARVVVLSSTAHTMGSVRTDDLHYSKGRSYSAWGAYGQSKMANLLFAMSLEKRFRDDGFASTCTAVSVHPGVIKTNLWKNTAFSSNIVVSWFGDVFLMKKTIPQGAATSIYAALHADAAQQEMRGAYLVDCAKGTPSGTSAELAKDLQLATNEQLKEKLGLLEN